MTKPILSIVIVVVLWYPMIWVGWSWFKRLRQA